MAVMNAKKMGHAEAGKYLEAVKKKIVNGAKRAGNEV
jgi:hypothetical protein